MLLAVMLLPLVGGVEFPSPKSTVTVVTVLLTEVQLPVAVDFNGTVPREGFIESLQATGVATWIVVLAKTPPLASRDSTGKDPVFV